MLKRSITGIIFVVVVFSLIMYEDFTATALLLIITAMCAFEYTNIARLGVKDTAFNLTMVLGVAPLIGSLIKPEFAEGYEYIILAISFAAILIISISTVGFNIRTNHNMLSPIIVLLYIGLPMAALSRILIQGEIYYKYILLGIMISLWVTDTGAYLVGRTIGKTPLHKRVSPKKTIEGWLGGGAFAIAGAYILSLVYIDIDFLQWLTISLVTWVFGTWGDLFESSIKRQFEIKDSGNLLPGHGGFLDRFDSFIFAAPIVVLILFSVYY